MRGHGRSFCNELQARQRLITINYTQLIHNLQLALLAHQMLFFTRALAAQGAAKSENSLSHGQFLSMCLRYNPPRLCILTRQRF